MIRFLYPNKIYMTGSHFKVLAHNPWKLAFLIQNKSYTYSAHFGRSGKRRAAKVVHIIDDQSQASLRREVQASLNDLKIIWNIVWSKYQERSRYFNANNVKMNIVLKIIWYIVQWGTKASMESFVWHLKILSSPSSSTSSPGALGVTHCWRYPYPSSCWLLWARNPGFHLHSLWFLKFSKIPHWAQS